MSESVHPVHPPPGSTIIIANKLFGNFARRQLAVHPQLPRKLLQARIPLVPSAFLAGVYGQAAIAAIIGLIPLVVYLVASQAGGGPAAALTVPLAFLPFVLAAMTYSYRMLQPDLIIRSRKRNLEANMPYALNFMAAMASAGVLPSEIYGALGAQPAYGEASREAAWIYRDTKVLAKDLVSALSAGAKRSPSQLWEEFLSGSVNTITSGGDLKTYFLAKSEQFQQENRRRLRAFLETLGVMGESYVVVAAAAPLFLIVIISVMMLLQEGTNPGFYLNLLILVVLPVIHTMFTIILRNMRPE